MSLFAAGIAMIQRCEEGLKEYHYGREETDQGIAVQQGQVVDLRQLLSDTDLDGDQSEQHGE